MRIESESQIAAMSSFVLIKLDTRDEVARFLKPLVERRQPINGTTNHNILENPILINNSIIITRYEYNEAEKETPVEPSIVTSISAEAVSIIRETLDNPRSQYDD